MKLNWEEGILGSNQKSSLGRRCMQRYQSKNIEIQEFVNFTFSALQKNGVGVKGLASSWFSPKNVSNISTFFPYKNWWKYM